MKELQKINADKTELHALKQFEKKTVFDSSTILHPGHRCFEINNKTLECVEAKFEAEVHFNSPNKRKIIIKEGYSYINALNKQNALKVFKRQNK